jgi:hypothetical protein
MSPLVLSVVALAYEGDPASSTAHLLLPGSADERFARLWEKYIDKMFEHRQLRRVAYTQEDAISWLVWLSNALTVRKVSEFQLDGFNTWPHFQRDTRRPETFLGRVPSYYRRPFWYFIGLWVYLVEACLLMLCFVSYIVGGPFQAGVLFGVAYIAVSPGDSIPSQLLIGTLTAVAATALVQRSRIRPTGWRLVEKFTWSRTQFYSNLGRRIEVGLGNGAVAGLIAGYRAGILNGFWHGLLLGGAISAVCVLAGGVAVESDPRAATDKVRPDFGVWRSLHNAIWIGGVTGFIGLAIGGLLGRSAAGNAGAITLGLGSAIGLALGVALEFGWGTWLQFMMNVDHLALARCGPWQYGKFLEAMSERLLLRRIGRSYAFVHIELQAYLANKHRGTGFVESGMIGRSFLWKFDAQMRTNMWVRFQPNVRDLIGRAEEEARWRKNDRIVPGHILYALLDQAYAEIYSGLLTRRQADDMREQLDRTLQTGTSPSWGDIVLTIESQKIFRAARLEARKRGGRKGIGFTDLWRTLAASGDPTVVEAFAWAGVDIHSLLEADQ